ncbi:Atg10 [Kluyveromyces lactis]|nr:Atg10 [Kluyveromyces lactis]
MLSLQQYNKQLPEIAKLVSRWDKASRVQLIKEISDHILVVNMRQKQCLTIELQITYDKIYQVPSIRFRLWEHALDDEDVFSSKLLFLSDVELRSIITLNSFSVSLLSDHTTKEVWYHVNNCDTDANVGTEPERYLLRWISLYLQIFDPTLNIMLI